MVSQIKISIAHNGQWWFKVIASNGKTLCSSETYHNYTDCYHAAQIVQRGGGIISM